MKKTFIVLLLAAVLCTSAFAANAEGNNGLWVGGTAGVYSAGYDSVYDFGRYDLDFSFRIPVTFFAMQAASDPTVWADIWETLLMDDFAVSGYYSLVDTNWFTMNVGAKFDLNSYVIISESNVGGAVSAFLSPSLQFKFQIANKVSINLSGFYYGFYFVPISDGMQAAAMGIPMSIGVAVPYGNDISAVIAMAMGRVYDLASISVLFKY